MLLIPEDCFLQSRRVQNLGMLHIGPLVRIQALSAQLGMPKTDH